MLCRLFRHDAATPVDGMMLRHYQLRAFTPRNMLPPDVMLLIDDARLFRRHADVIDG